METDEELRQLLNKLLQDIISKKIETEPAKKFDVGPGSPNGIYKFKDNNWVLLRVNGLPLNPGEDGDGIYVIYFDNTQCPACRRYDPEWFEFVKGNSNEAHFYIVLCEWFARQCNSKAASLTFILHNVKASPTTIFALVKNGAIIKTEKVEGVTEKDKLAVILQSLKNNKAIA